MKRLEELYVAVRAHVVTKCGRGLLRVLERQRIGRCVLGEGLLDSLRIAADAAGRGLVLLGCAEGEREGYRRLVVEPLRSPEGWEALREDLQLSLSGDVDVRGTANALRLFVEEPFIVVEVSANAEERAYELAMEALGELCA
ncbi:MAG: hypothetical protein N3F67_05135 [Acidilobaceae archaeon]|nr:hypothetical protein [Acidilobaceae archaeon]